VTQRRNERSRDRKKKYIAYLIERNV
jgi:hypothetical protein